CGLAVVTTDAGGIPFVVKDGSNGIVVARGNYEALAQGIIQVIENSELAERLIGQAYIDCRQYTWEAVGQQWVSLYGKLAGHVPATFEPQSDNQQADGIQIDSNLIRETR